MFRSLPKFEFLSPKSIKEAISLLAEYGPEAKVIAGGTDVMADLRKGKIAPRCLVDITRVSGLDQIRVSDECVEVLLRGLVDLHRDRRVFGGMLHPEDAEVIFR